MIISRFEVEVDPRKMDEGIEQQKSLFVEGGVYEGLKHRIYTPYFSGQRSVIVTEFYFESLSDFEATQLERLEKVTETQWKEYAELFDRRANWTHWFVRDEG